MAAASLSSSRLHHMPFCLHARPCALIPGMKEEIEGERDAAASAQSAEHVIYFACNSFAPEITGQNDVSAAPVLLPDTLPLLSSSTTSLSLPFLL